MHCYIICIIGIMYLWQMRVRILQSYINDLTDQNAVLVKSVEDLEVDANSRVGRLESKLQKASGVIKVMSHDSECLWTFG